MDARVAPVDPGDARGVLITGGDDIGAAFHPVPPEDPSLIQGADEARDRWEFAAIRHALDRGLPLFAICRGCQALNLALGGTLHLDIPGHDLPEMKSANVQPLRHAAGNRHRLDAVNSSHHQAIDRLGTGLEVEAWHAGDGVIEQIALRGKPWVRGVQYHPERDALYTPLFDDFLAQLGPA